MVFIQHPNMLKCDTRPFYCRELGMSWSSSVWLTQNSWPHQHSLTPVPQASSNKLGAAEAGESLEGWPSYAKGCQSQQPNMNARLPQHACQATLTEVSTKTTQTKPCTKQHSWSEYSWIPVFILKSCSGGIIIIIIIKMMILILSIDNNKIIVFRWIQFWHKGPYIR